MGAINHKKEMMILKEVLKELKSLPAHDMAIGAAIFCVGEAIRHLKENNHKPKIIKAKP